MLEANTSLPRKKKTVERMCRRTDSNSDFNENESKWITTESVADIGLRRTCLIITKDIFQKSTRKRAIFLCACIIIFQVVVRRVHSVPAVTSVS